MKNYFDKDLIYNEPRELKLVFDDEEMEIAFLECMIAGYAEKKAIAEKYPEYEDDVKRLDKIFEIDLGFTEEIDL